MPKLFFALIVALFWGQMTIAQKPAAPEKNDPAAKKMLDKVRKQYDGYKTFEAAFALVIEVPGETKTTQKGTVGQQGDRFRLEMADQTIVSDAKTTWVYLKKNNEVQITDAESSEGGDNGFMTPKDLLKRYEKGDFLYAITEKTTEKGKAVAHIEFKPKDKKSEYSKLRVSIDEKGNSIVAIRAFAKDGSRYAFNIEKFTPNKAFAADYFTFDAKKYQGVKVEDLRM